MEQSAWSRFGRLFEPGGEPRRQHQAGHDHSLYACARPPAMQMELSTGNQVVSSLAVSADGSTVFFGSNDDSLFAVGADGDLKWSFPTMGTYYQSPALLGC